MSCAKLSHSIDLASQTGLLAGSAILVIYMICSSLIDRLASKRKEGLRFVSVSSFYSIKNTTGSSANAGLFSGVLRMALRIRFYTQDRCFDIRQMIHPLDNLLRQTFYHAGQEKATVYFEGEGSKAVVERKSSCQ